MFRFDPVVMFGRALGMIAEQAEPSDPLARDLLRWVGRIEQEAVERWRHVLMSGIRCVVPDRKNGALLPCGDGAIAACAACYEPTCLRHAMVASNGDVVCLRCVNECVGVVRERVKAGGARPEQQNHARANHPGAGEDPVALRKAHLKTLGLKDPADWEEIEAEYKALLKKWHPDRAAPGKREAAEAKFKKVRVAYDWLQANKDRKVA